MKRYFITGTDTDCGKTYVTTQLLKSIPNSAALKPVASGCVKENGQWVNSDALILQEANNISLTLDQLNPWRFPLAVSPHIAAREEGVDLDVPQIAKYCLDFEHPKLKTLFIEGAGGLLAPLNHKESWLDFLKLTQIPVILVVGMRLGCLNHALLTQAVLHAHSIECYGWIANCIDFEMQFRKDNIDTLIHQIRSPLLTTIDYNQQAIQTHMVAI